LQAGWFTDALVARVNNDTNLQVVGQAYRDRMQPVDPAAVRDDLRRRGISDARVKVFYGVYYKVNVGQTIETNMPIPPLEGWDGILFDLDHAN